MSSQTKLAVIGVVFAIALVAVPVVWQVNAILSDPNVPFLIGENNAQWIRLNTTEGPTTFTGSEQTTLFRTSFFLAAVPEEAILTIRPFRNASILLDGKVLAETRADPKEWKRRTLLDLAPALTPGDHELSLVVRNSLGPPCVLAYCEALGLYTGTGWDARSEQLPQLEAQWGPQWGAAVSVNSPQANTLGRSLPRADKALMRKAPLFLAIFLVVFVLTLTLNRETDPIHPFHRLARSPETVRWTILAALTVLAANNITKIPITLGFDAYYHLEYIEYVARTWRVPLADEGWQMFQSPLYYFLSALLYHLFSQFLSLARTDEALRILPLICGIMQVEVCYRMLKQTYPGQRTLQSLGLVLGGLLPINVYLSQSLSNEPLAALFTSLAILAAIRLQYAPRDNWPLRTFLLLGALLGLALLTKVSAILLCPPLFLLIIFTAHDKHSTTAKTVTASAQALGVVFGLAFLVCGWYYIRNWVALGAPFVGGWENTRGFTWWQEPGYRTIHQYFTFGQALTYPMFSGVQGYWDGFYITLWLDGLNGGSISTEVRSMRNFDFMLSGAWLSLLPTVALILGAIAILGKPATSARNGQLFALLCAGIYMLAVAKLSLVNPNYCSFKAGYTLGVLPCYAVIGAQGFRYLTKNEYARAATIALMACWATSVCIAYYM